MFSGILCPHLARQHLVWMDSPNTSHFSYGSVPLLLSETVVNYLKHNHDTFSAIKRVCAYFFHVSFIHVKCEQPVWRVRRIGTNLLYVSIDQHCSLRRMIPNQVGSNS
jgi:hypothetical protein